MISTLDLSKRAISALNDRSLEFKATHYTEYSERVFIGNEEVTELFKVNWYGDIMVGSPEELKQKLHSGKELHIQYKRSNELAPENSYDLTLVFLKTKGKWSLSKQL